MKTRALVGWLCGALVACGPSSGGAPIDGLQKFPVHADAIAEASGLARSQRNAHLLWTNNDSGNAPEIYAIDDRGRFVGTLNIQGASNVDWEDLASFVEDGSPRLLVADIGDNHGLRQVITFHVVDEPDLSKLTPPFAIETRAVRTIAVRYPDGPRDAESVFVDAREGAIYFLSKRDAVPRLYRVPLRPAAREVTAEALGEIPVPRATPEDRKPKRINWVTSMDADDAGTQLVLITMERAHLYRREGNEPWAAALRRAPKTFRLPDYDQIEGVAFAPDGKWIHVISEGSPAPFAKVPLPAP